MTTLINDHFVLLVLTLVFEMWLGRTRLIRANSTIDLALDLIIMVLQLIKTARNKDGQN